MKTIYFILLNLSIIVNSLKLCINCKHYIPATSPPIRDFAECKLFPVKIIDYTQYNREQTLTKSNKNSLQMRYKYCNVQRMDENACGDEGKFYEEKP